MVTVQYCAWPRVVAGQGRFLLGELNLPTRNPQLQGVDTKPCLTTAVGSLLPLLPEMEGTVPRL